MTLALRLQLFVVRSACKGCHVEQKLEGGGSQVRNGGSAVTNVAKVVGKVIGVDQGQPAKGTAHQ